MNVVHILKDGQVVNDISGHIVKMSDAQELYILIDLINEKGVNHNEAINKATFKSSDDRNWNADDVRVCRNNGL